MVRCVTQCKGIPCGFRQLQSYPPILWTTLLATCRKLGFPLWGSLECHSIKHRHIRASQQGRLLLDQGGDAIAMNGVAFLLQQGNLAVHAA